MGWFLRWLGFLMTAVTVTLAAPAGAQQGDVGPASPINTLDGRRFAGQFVPSGKLSGRPDDFIFADGRFHSRQCLAFGFTPGPYWVRAEEGKLHFFARLTSEENGVMIYEGSVAGKDMVARVEWIKPRWYWKMKRDFKFKGVSVAGAPEKNR